MTANVLPALLVLALMWALGALWGFGLAVTRPSRGARLAARIVAVEAWLAEAHAAGEAVCDQCGGSHCRAYWASPRRQRREWKQLEKAVR